jgi:hypothetical protein
MILHWECHRHADVVDSARLNPLSPCLVATLCSGPMSFACQSVFFETCVRATVTKACFGEPALPGGCLSYDIQCLFSGSGGCLGSIRKRRYSRALDWEVEAVADITVVQSRVDVE